MAPEGNTPLFSKEATGEIVPEGHVPLFVKEGSGEILHGPMLDKLKAAGRALKQELKVYQLVLRDKRTPWLAKFVLGIAVGYFLLPFDLIPDFIPVLGHLDDALLVPLLVIVALKLIPREIVTDCRRQAASQ